MSVDSFIFLRDDRLPGIGQWQAALDHAKTGIVLDKIEDLRQHTGYLPAKYNGAASGFEWFYGQIEEYFGGEIPGGLGDRTHVVDLVTHSDMRETICAMIAEAVLAQIADGLVGDENSEIVISGDKALQIARDEAPAALAAELELKKRRLPISFLPIEIKWSRPKLALALFATLAFIALGAFLISHGSSTEKNVGLLVLILLSIGIPFFVRRLFDKRPCLVINQEGILDRTLGSEVIPWADITGVYSKIFAGNDFVCIAVRNPAYWLSQLSPVKRKLFALNRAPDFPILVVNLSCVSNKKNEILHAIQKMIARRQSDK